MINTASNLTSDLGVKDTQSGFRAFSKRALNLLAFENEGMESTLEVLDQIKEKARDKRDKVRSKSKEKNS